MDTARRAARRRTMKNVLVFAVLAVGLCLPPSSSAGPLGPTKASDLRTVLGLPGSTPCPGLSTLRAVDSQQNPNGTIVPFSVPVKSVFIVTSFDVAGSGSAGSASETALIVADGIGGNSFVARCGGIVGSNGLAIGSCTTPAGVAVKGGSTLCFEPNTSNVIVRGFMAKDK
jgi:hypothetical protein